MKKILFSACLAGLPVRYNGSAKRLINEQITRWRHENRLVTFCPELAAGFSTPRPAAEIRPTDRGDTVITAGCRVIEQDGNDVTQRYVLGAWLALEMAQQNDCLFALLTEGSPSCGSHRIYDGQFRHQTKPGIGATAELLTKHGIEVFSEDELDKLCARVNQYDRQYQATE